MPSLSENIEVVRVSSNHVVVDHFEMFSSTPSIISNFSVNHFSQVSTVDKCFQHSLDGGRSKNVNEIVKTIQQRKNKRGCYIRKSSWTSTNVTSFIDDGHAWRKYGQKEIIKAKHKRNYYRCANKFDQGCQATKQVQKIEDEPPMYKITYNRHHTCKNFLSTHQIILDTTNHKDTSNLLCFESNGTTEKEELTPNFPSNLLYTTNHKDTSILSFESNGTIEKELVTPNFPSNIQEEPNDSFSSLDLKQSQLSSFDHTLLYDHILSEHLGPMPQMPSSSEHGDVIPTGVYLPFYELDYMLETIRLSEIPLDFSYTELTGLHYL